MKNIFQAGGALSASHSTYIKREADQDARQAVLQGDYLHVIAPRQVGKTSLLKQLAHQLKDIGWHYAYVDFSTLMDLPKTEWYRELGRELARTLTPNHSPMLTNQIQLRSYLLYTALKEQPHIILLFDEVEGVGQARDNNGQPFSDTFFSTLRNFFIQRDDYEGTLVVALAGAVNPNDLVQDPGISPFNIGQKISLDNFTAAETQTLTQHLTQLDCSLEPEVYQAIYHWTNGHPYLTQRLCAELEKGVRNGRFTTLSPAEVTAVVEQTLLNPANPLQQDSNLRHVGKMLDRLSPSAAKLWSRLQAGETVTRYEAVGDLYLELYLTGAVKADAENLIIRNQIYKQAFAPAKAQKKKQPASLNQPRSSTMTQPFRIFISSTWVDLKPEREAVEKALHRMQSTAFAGMEYFGSRPETPKQISLDGVDSSDIYIGIFAHRYGSGITEDEYRRAQAKGLPCLIYLKSDEA
ncbi:MAG: AAA-like domain-containing protein, partial [Anaerolineales bacterium]|nr:AAA-like domain-containing protein [Anaerolineales bacterium]